MAEAIGYRHIRADPPFVLGVIFEAVGANISGQVQEALSERPHSSQQEIGECLLIVEGARGSGSAGGSAGASDGTVAVYSESWDTIRSKCIRSLIACSRILILAVVIPRGPKFDGVVAMDLGDIRKHGVILVEVTVRSKGSR